MDKLYIHDEPRLRFCRGEHICPRKGIAEYGVYDMHAPMRRREIQIGSVGRATGLEKLADFLGECERGIEAPEEARHPALVQSFPEMLEGRGFNTQLIYGSQLSRTIREQDLTSALEHRSHSSRVSAVLDVYYNEIKFLAQNRQIDVIVCVIPDDVFDKISAHEPAEEDGLKESVDTGGEFNFRRALKAKAMHLAKPLQLVREISLAGNRATQQARCVRAWNLITAIYYKSGPVVPWRLANTPDRPTECALGVAFYRSRDRQITNTSLAQVFDELGTGIIMRGTPVSIDKDNRVPHLNEMQAYELFKAGLGEYRVALKSYPARVVVHKSSSYFSDELAGFKAAGEDLGIDTIDFVTVLDSKLRLLRDGAYPVYRGTSVQLTRSQTVLYTRGSVWYYRTYPGLYIPQPIEIRIAESNESPNFLAREILGLTKMNWNNTQFDGKYPVTLGCARKVGEVLKYVGADEHAPVRYAYYM